MLSKSKIVFLALLAALLLSGCAMSTVEDMYAPPKRSEAFSQLQHAIDLAMEGRDYVIPDDVKYLAPFVLAHRLQLSSESRLSGLRAEAVVARILQDTPVPPEKARLFHGKE